MRAFVALAVLPPALEQVESLAGQLSDTVPGVRWAPLETAHITLHFFGQISDQRVACAVQALEPVFAGQPPIQLRLSGLGAFPSETRPRVLWCGVDGDTDSLRALGGRCSSTLASAGFAVDRRPFHPHCTLGRPSGLWAESARQRWIEAASQHQSTDDFTANVAVLYESLTGPMGARHLPRITLPLRG